MKLRALLETSKYTKFRQYLWGFKKTKGIAIMTPENPNSVTLSNEENNKLMVKGKDLLKANGHNNYDKQKGLYGNMANSLIVYDISEDEAKEIGKGWVQDSIIFITQGNTKKRIKPLFDMIRINPKSKWLDVPNILVENIMELTDTAEMYSQIGNNKYEIPFFGDDAVKVDSNTHNVSDDKIEVKKQA